MDDAPGPASTKGIQITVTDLDTGESESRTIWDDYMLVCAGSCYRHHVTISGSGSTHVVTIKGRKDDQRSARPAPSSTEGRLSA